MNKCRSCAAEQLASIIPLGKLPLANALLSQRTDRLEPRYNLEVDWHRLYINKAEMSSETIQKKPSCEEKANQGEVISCNQ